MSVAGLPKGLKQREVFYVHLLELLNIFAMKERGERRETEMGLKIGLERRRNINYVFFFLNSFGECSGTVFSTSLKLGSLTSRYKLNNFTMIKPLCGSERMD